MDQVAGCRQNQAVLSLLGHCTSGGGWPRRLLTGEHARLVSLIAVRDASADRVRMCMKRIVACTSACPPCSRLEALVEQYLQPGRAFKCHDSNGCLAAAQRWVEGLQRLGGEHLAAGVEDG
jgi:hypothetical protein